LSERDLIQAAVQKDEQAWEALVKEHQQPVFRLAYLFTGDPDEAEDITQEAFIHAFYSIGKFDPSRPFRPWVLSIAANLARNRLRGIKRYLSLFQRWIRTEPEAGLAARQDIQQPMEVKALWQTVRQLSPADQQMIYLRYFLELSEEETAGVLGVPQGTVKSRLHRALKRLRARLEQDEPGFNEVITHE
jgi:RNA polymerase sigma-70 factor (ECF subfamily)